MLKTGKSVVDFKSSINESSDEVNFIAEQSKTKKIGEETSVSFSFFYENLKKCSHTKSCPTKKVYRCSVSRK